jgi:hypothetical protein
VRDIEKDPQLINRISLSARQAFDSAACADWDGAGVKKSGFRAIFTHKKLPLAWTLSRNVSVRSFISLTAVQQ